MDCYRRQRLAILGSGQSVAQKRKEMEHEPKYSPGIKQKYIKNAVLTKVGYQAAGKLENKKCT